MKIDRTWEDANLENLNLTGDGAGVEMLKDDVPTHTLGACTKNQETTTSATKGPIAPTGKQKLFQKCCGWSAFP